MGSSTTTRNFGMRRFTNLVREGRFRAPASGTELRLGTLVEIDPSDTDRIRQATATAICWRGYGPNLGLCGILWYEHDSQTFNSPRVWGSCRSTRTRLGHGHQRAHGSGSARTGSQGLVP